MERGEAKIIRACQKGELGEFSALYGSYAKKIYNFIYYKTFQKELAEDICSQTFLKALKNIQKYDEKKGAFSSWLFQIAKNTLIDHYRCQKEYIDIETIWDLKSHENIEIDLETKEILEKTKKYLDKLNPEQKQIIIMRIWDQLSYQEISEILGKSKASCKMMFSRTINKLRNEMPLDLLLLLLIIHNLKS